MKKKITMLALAGFTFISMFAQANRDTVKLEDVVVVGTRWQQSTNTTPSKITSITQSEVELLNPQTGADLLGATGKVFIQKSQQGGGSPMIRGFATKRLLYAVDGVRMNNAIFRAGNLQYAISLDPFAMERTEVLFGPGSVLYGSDAIGGVMSFQTLTPHLSTSDKPYVKSNFTARYSSANNEKTGHVDVNVGWKKWSILSSISSFDYDDMRMGQFGPDLYLNDRYVERIDNNDVEVANRNPLVQKNTGYTHTNMMQKVRYKPSESWDLQYAIHHSETSDYGRYDRTTRVGNTGLLDFAEWYYGPQIWMMNNFSAEHTYSNAMYDKATLRLAVQNFEESRINRKVGNNKRKTQVENVDAYSLNLDFLKNIKSNNSLFYGFEYVLNDIESDAHTLNITNGKTEPTGTRYSESDWTSVALYVNDQHKVNDQLSLQAGLRYNLYDININFANTGLVLPFDAQQSIRSGSLSGSVGALYTPDESWAIRLNLSRGFRAPNIDDIGKTFESSADGLVVPNPNIKSEYANNVELGIAKQFGNVFSFDVTGYYTYLENAMVRRDFQLVAGQDSIMYDGEMYNTQAIQNAAYAQVYGIQLGFNANLTNGFSLSGNLNYQEGTEEMDDGTKSPTRHTPPLFGNVNLTYKRDRLTMRLYTQFQGSRTHEQMTVEERGKKEHYPLDADGNTYVPGWTTLNFKSNFQVNRNVTVSAGIENITDQRYRTYASGFTAAGRNFVSSVRYHF